MLALSMPVLAAACGGAPTLSATGDALADMRADITALQARAEHAAETVRVKHVLIQFKGVNRSRATRSKEEAEMLAAEIYKKATAGEDFDALMKQSEDPGPGDYTMSTAAKPPAGAFKRSGPGGMVAAFGDVGWRLEVGQVGVAPFDAVASPFGWHIIKRLEPK
ncbi:MAG: peptidylprolyl isomerase [Planctomycetes bacterium]|nr:peptidylprolyl isomerase [Planctomycetota bacterium]